MNKIPLSVVVITKNEEANIEMCLKSVYGWVDEIVVVDDESRDRTVELASKYADKILHRKMDNEGIHRNWSYAQARNAWVLSLDADEYVSDGLKEELIATVPNHEMYVYSIPLKNYIGSYWVQYSGWYPAGKTRLFNRHHFKYEDVGVHPRVFLMDDKGEIIKDPRISGGRNGHLTKDIVHKGYPDFEHFLGSLNRQTTLEAQKWIQTGRKMSLGQAIWRTIDRFPRSFIGKKGYKDGFIGFMIAFFASLYQIISYAKYWQILRESNVSHQVTKSPSHQ